MWDDDGWALDSRSEARDEARDEAAWDEHQDHDSKESPVEQCSWCEDEVAEREIDARAEIEGKVSEAA